MIVYIEINYACYQLPARLLYIITKTSLDKLNFSRYTYCICTSVQTYMSVTATQGPSTIIFVKKMAQRCGVWQIKRMTSQDQDQASMKSNMFGFGGHSQMKF